jgi:hypothetical protein
MKTIFTRLFAIVILTISISSCSENNDATTGSVVGKWTPVQTSILLAGAPIQTFPYDDNTVGCDKNYYEFIAGGVLKLVEYTKVNNVCTPITEQGTWTQAGNVLTANNGTEVNSVTIESLTATQMVWKDTMVEAGITYTLTITFSKI